MALPVVITGAFGAILAGIGRKTITAAAAIAAMVSLTAVFIAGINMLIDSMMASLSLPSWIANSIGLFVPANFSAVVGIIVSSYITRAAYDLAMGKIKAINAAN